MAPLTATLETSALLLPWSARYRSSSSSSSRARPMEIDVCPAVTNEDVSVDRRSTLIQQQPLGMSAHGSTNPAGNQFASSTFYCDVTALGVHENFERRQPELVKLGVR
ncbi:hypothetical protein TTRE_0000446301 [Trichuris trichiura]|uniref:Uncharacterized protein n=1 Tax=Trichuris trichiura TaxID=36087 RepID=A0A077Z978_TRITR|nr:hypothetical protein TTRE_0000446301 [Trichuris trichiura]